MGRGAARLIPIRIAFDGLPQPGTSGGPTSGNVGGGPWPA